MAPLIAVDLGKRVSGIALFVDGRLATAAEVRVTVPTVAAMAWALYNWAADYGRGTRWVAEKMLDYDAKGARSRDLEHLRRVATALHGYTGDMHLYPAHKWKGQVPKAITQRRILRHLALEERFVIEPISKETMDAVGLGLFVLGRLRRGMASAI